MMDRAAFREGAAVRHHRMCASWITHAERGILACNCDFGAGFPPVGSTVRVLGSPGETFTGAVGSVTLSASVTHVSFPDGRSERFWYEDLERCV